MSRSLRLLIAIALSTLAITATAHATPLTLYYEVDEVSPGLFQYQFSLVLDDHDGSWQSGDQFSWFVYGDRLYQASLIADFLGDPADLPIGPYDFYSVSSGIHNGPSLSPVTNPWVPSSLGESLSWSGTSIVHLGAGDLLWSNLDGTGVPANLEVAHLIMPPEPEVTFIRGDANTDGVFDISDAVFVLLTLFIPGTEPAPCFEAANANDDQTFDISDGVFILATLFVPGTPGVPAPHPDCGVDTTGEPLACDSYPECP